MGSLFRSEEMSLCQLFLHTDSAYMCIAELGELGLVQFKDCAPDTSSFQRKFVNEVRRCDEMERKLRYLENEIKKDGIPMLDLGENPEAPAAREMIDLEVSFEKLVSELQEINTNTDALKKNYFELVELRHLLAKAQIFFDEDGSSNTTGTEGFRPRRLSGDTSEQAIISKDTTSKFGERDQRIQFLAGVIDRRHVPSFELMLWRACHGNVFLKKADIDTPLEDPAAGDPINKSVFIAFFQGDQLRIRVKKISEAFHANLFPCPDSPEERAEMLSGVETRIDDLKTVLSTTQDHRQRVLVIAAKSLREWFIKVRKIKAIYHILNLFNVDVTSRAMIGECWCPVEDLASIHGALHRGMERSRSSVAPILNRVSHHTEGGAPTFHRTNRFTSGFQAIVDAYGVAKYQEVNPAPFTVITFPFLFAVMFGDAGHGVLMFLFALWMVFRERHFMAQKNKDEMWKTIFGGRYIILLMGAFSIYTGLIYNDIFSKPFNIFGSAWRPIYSMDDLELEQTLQLNPDQSNPNNTMYVSGRVYPFGIDPVWQLAKNKITFTNSIKMKMSIIFGVMHMVFGVVLGVFNHCFFKDYARIYCEFIPQVLFILSLFGYLVILFFIKWLKFSGATANCAPSLLIAFVNMFLNFGRNGPPLPHCEGVNVHPGETIVRPVLLCVALICVPWMLFSHPLLIWYRRRQGYRYMENVEDGRLNAPEDADAQHADQAPPPHDSGDHNQIELSELFTYQSIHTIEYCLGCISNTASYLRLWALSLAHAQLSEVLWDMLFRKGLNINSFGGSAAIFFIFAIWAGLTVGILVCMEGMSAFLHALRLHWVEFQNKFYQGAGYLFTPFTFSTYTDIVLTAE